MTHVVKCKTTEDAIKVMHLTLEGLAGMWAGPDQPPLDGVPWLSLESGSRAVT